MGRDSPLDIVNFLKDKHDASSYAEFCREVLEKKADSLVMKAFSLGFFEAPASTQYHHAYPGGLAVHSLEVFVWTERLSQVFEVPFDEFAKVSSMFHDLCKADLYERSYRNVRDDETGQWNRVDAYKQVDSALGCMGHGEESLRRIEEVVGRWPDGWAHAVRWHMGAYKLYDEQLRQYSATVAKYPQVLLLHTADMCSSTKLLT